MTECILAVSLLFVIVAVVVWIYAEVTRHP